VSESFRAHRVDGWLVAPVVIASFVEILAVFVGWVGPLYLLPGLGGAFATWLLVGARYEVSKDHLNVRFGPFRSRHPLESVRSLRTVREPSSPDGASLESVEVHHTSGLLVLSPRNPKALVTAILSRAPHVVVDDVHEPSPGRPGGGPRTARNRVTAMILTAVVLLASLGFVAIKVFGASNGRASAP